jgi:hypothetical protein
MFIKTLVKIADKLDRVGQYKLASDLDEIIRHIVKAENENDIGSQEEEVIQQEENVDTKTRVQNAFNANPDNVQKVLVTRNPGPNAMGSVFGEAQTPQSLAAADWQPYSHPSIQSPAAGFVAKIPGTVGVVELNTLNPSMPVKLVDGHETGFLAPAVQVPRGIKSEHTTLLLGPIDKDGTEGVWTFFPGDPILPSELKADDVPEDKMEITVSEAINMGFEFAKVLGQ